MRRIILTLALALLASASFAADTLTPNPKQQYFINGLPCVGCQLFTYAAGTLTKLATYTDSTGGTSNNNPILLDSQGNANVWLPSATFYKFILAPPTDTDPPTNPYWTVDQISSNTIGALNANSVYGNATASSAAGTSLAMPSCADSAGQHLNYTTNVGFSCGSSVSSYFYSGSVNKLRGNSLTQWYGGTSITESTSGGWASEGVYVLPTGASVTASQVTSPQTGGPYYALKILGNTSNTDVKVRFPIESYDAAVLAGQVVTFQITYQNKSGGSLTPTLTTKYAGAQDNWSSPVTDLAATNMQVCVNNAICTAAYTLNVNASANLGYTPTVDFGALTSGNYIEIVSFDMRVTATATVGLNSNPPVPEIRHPQDDALWCQRFYATSYANGTAPGTVTTVGALAMRVVGTNGFLWTTRFPVQMRAAPTVTYYSPNTGSSSVVYDVAAAADFDTLVQHYGSPQSVEVDSVNGTASDQVIFHWTADARIAGG